MKFLTKTIVNLNGTKINADDYCDAGIPEYALVTLTQEKAKLILGRIRAARETRSDDKMFRESIYATDIGTIRWLKTSGYNISRLLAISSGPDADLSQVWVAIPNDVFIDTMTPTYTYDEKTKIDPYYAQWFASCGSNGQYGLRTLCLSETSVEQAARGFLCDPTLEILSFPFDPTIEVRRYHLAGQALNEKGIGAHITHTPTGLETQSETEPTFEQNKVAAKRAMRLLWAPKFIQEVV